MKSPILLFFTLILFFCIFNCKKDLTSIIESEEPKFFDIAYDCWRDYGPVYDIYLFNAKECSKKCLTKDFSGGGSLPQFTYDGSRIVFADNQGIKIMDCDGNNVSRVYLHVNVSKYFDVSTTENKVVYNLYFPNYLQDYSDLFLYDLDIRMSVKLTNSDGWVFSPKFIPYHSKIVYRKGEADLNIVSFDGSSRSRIFQSDSSIQDINIFPDGSKIVFKLEKRTLPHHFMICSIDIDGNNFKILTDELKESSDPWVSPKGDKIVFISRMYINSDLDIYIMNTDGTNKINLTNSSGDQYCPRFSPDGNKIVYADAANTDVFIMDSNGENKYNITNSNERESNPVFRPAK